MKTIIQIGNSMSQISGLSSDDLKKLRSKLSYEIETGKVKYVYKTVEGKKNRVAINEKARKSLVGQRGSFPSGLLPRVEEWCKKNGTAPSVRDTREEPSLTENAIEELGTMPTELGGRPFHPHNWQIFAACAALEYGRGIVRAPTGTGKSIAAGMILHTFGVKTLIVTPNLGLKRQLTQGINEFFGTEVAGPLVKRKAEFAVTIENVDQLRVTDDLSGVHLLIVDEYHHAAAMTYRTLDKKLFKSIYWKIGLTATPFRSNDAEQILMESMLGQIIYELGYKQAVQERLICPIRVFSVPVPRVGPQKVHTVFHEAYRAGIVENQTRNELIVDLASKCHEAGKSTLILCRQIDHGNALKDLFWEKGQHDIPFAEGKSDVKDFDIDSFVRQEHSSLIGTVGVLGEGVDTKPAQFGFLVGGGKAKVQLMQNLGRLFRMFTGKTMAYAFLFHDKDGNWLESHYKQCVEHIEMEYGIKVEPLPKDWEKLLEE